MKNLVILGAGTAGTMVANRIRRQLPRDWALTVIDPESEHLYQPGGFVAGAFVEIGEDGVIAKVHTERPRAWPHSPRQRISVARCTKARVNAAKP